MKMSITDVGINRCEFENIITLYSSQFYMKRQGTCYCFPLNMPTETVHLSFDLDIRRGQLRMENLKANRKCNCDRCNPETI